MARVAPGQGRLAAAQAWRPEKVAAKYDQFFRKVIEEVQTRSYLLPSER